MQKLADISMFEAISNQAGRIVYNDTLHTRWYPSDNSFLFLQRKDAESPDGFYKEYSMEKLRDELFTQDLKYFRDKALAADPNHKLMWLYDQLLMKSGSYTEKEQELINRVEKDKPYVAEGNDLFFTLLESRAMGGCLSELKKSLLKFPEEDRSKITHRVLQLKPHLERTPRSVLLLASYLDKMSNLRSDRYTNAVKGFLDFDYRKLPPSALASYERSAANMWAGLFQNILKEYAVLSRK